MDVTQASSLQQQAWREVDRAFDERCYELPIDEQRAALGFVATPPKHEYDADAWMLGCKAARYAERLVGLDATCAELEESARSLVSARRAAVEASSPAPVDFAREAAALAGLHGRASALRLLINVAREFRRYHGHPAFSQPPPNGDGWSKYHEQRTYNHRFNLDFLQTFFNVLPLYNQPGLTGMPLAERTALLDGADARAREREELSRLHALQSVRTTVRVTAAGGGWGATEAAAVGAGGAASRPPPAAAAALAGGPSGPVLLKAVFAARDDLATAERRHEAALASTARAEASLRAVESALQAERDAAAAAAGVRGLRRDAPALSESAAALGAATALETARAQCERALRESVNEAARFEAVVFRAQADLDMATARFNAETATAATDAATAAASDARARLAAAEADHATALAAIKGERDAARDDAERLRARLSSDAPTREAALSALADAELAACTAQLRAAVATAEALVARRAAEAARAAEEARFNAAVAAAAAAAAAKMAAEAAPQCVVCMAAPAERVLSPCGHRCVCAACVEPLLAQRRCPVCRTAFTDAIRVFG